MLKDIVEVKHLGKYRLYIRFEDGIEGEVKVDELIKFEGIFSSLRDTKTFAQVCVHSELGTIYWPNGADLDPDVLYSKVTSQPISVASKERVSVTKGV
jgi:hypothetical protein